MNDLVDIAGLKAAISGVGDQISTAINVEKVRKLIPHRNILDNWYFINPINQLGETTYSGRRRYTIDRWEMLSSNNTVQLLDNGISISAGPTVQTAGDGFWQVTDLVKEDFPDNPKFTFSVLDDDGKLYTYTDYPVDNLYWDILGFDTDFGKMLMTWRMNVDHNLCARVWIDYNKSVTLVAAKLEMGEYQTLAHLGDDGKYHLLDTPPNKQQELAKCQKYMIAMAVPDNIVGWKFLGMGQATSSETCDILVSLPVTIRSTPTVSYTGQFRLLPRGSWTGAYDVTSITARYLVSTGLDFVIHTTGGLTIGSSYTLCGMATSELPSNLLLDANL